MQKMQHMSANSLAMPVLIWCNFPAAALFNTDAPGHAIMQAPTSSSTGCLGG